MFILFTYDIASLFFKVRGKFAFRVPPSTPMSEGNLENPDGVIAPRRHDRAGLVSVPRGGGVFDFTITLAALPELDATNVVIGEVISSQSSDGSSEDALAYLNSIPVIQYLGQGKGSDASRSKSCIYGSADTFCSQLRPIKKTTITTDVL